MRVIEVKESAFADNDAIASATRRALREQGTFMINVMSAPGSGKTTLLTALIGELKREYKVVAMDVDIETDLDADRLARGAGIECVQIHNGGLCHIDAYMVRDALAAADFGSPDLIVLENIGNLVCPAEFDTGAHLNMMLSSVTEGNDKPLKYPLMFTKCDIVVVTKSDVLGVFDFDVDKFKERVKHLNRNAKIIVVSAKTGEGMRALTDEIQNRIKIYKENNLCRK